MKSRASRPEGIPETGSGSPYRIGSPIAWMPAAFVEYAAAPELARVTGHVCYVNDEHRYCTAISACNGYAIRENFKF